MAKELTVYEPGAEVPAGLRELSTGATIEVVRVERLSIVGPREQGEACLRWLFENGYMVTRSGPYTDKAMYPTVDVTRFLFIAEKENPA